MENGTGHMFGCIGRGVVPCVGFGVDDTCWNIDLALDSISTMNGMPACTIILPVFASITSSTQVRAAYDKVLEHFSRRLMRRYADKYYFGAPVVADVGIEYNFYFSAYDDALPAWRYPNLDHTQNGNALSNQLCKHLLHDCKCGV